MTNIIQKDVLLAMTLILIPFGTASLQRGAIWEGLAIFALAIVAFVARIYFKIDDTKLGK